MANKMLIDAAHPEETRVVVLRGNRVEEFDFESATRKQLRGNIYLAKVTRVEPSLQAAFVDYGGNRHGFLAFSEIHPDYYQIPVADRQALIEAEEPRARRRRKRQRRRWRARASPRPRRKPDSVSERAEAPARNGAAEPTATSIRRTEIAADRRADPTTTSDGRRHHQRRAGRLGRRRGRAGRSAGAPPGPRPPVQDPGSDQAPPGAAGPGRQGRARQQGRGADHLSVARRPLFGADAEHGARRRHFAQDHQPGRPQAAEGRRRAISKCRRAWASSCAPPAPAAPRPRSSATSNICCACGRTSAN